MVGLALIAALHFRNIKGSILIGILSIALAFYAIKGPWPTHFVALPTLRFLNLDFSAISGEFVRPLVHEL